MKPTTISLSLCLALVLSGCEPEPAAPIMFDGTIFVDPDIIVNTDPGLFTYLTPVGSGLREMYDNRVNAWTQVNAMLFTASYADGRKIEVQVNPEFGSAAARSQAELYATAVGLLPTRMLQDVRTIAIQKGNEAFGGGNKNLLVHTDRGAEYMRLGILEETLLHEAAHTSLDPYFANDPDWINAQSRDARFISNYSRENPAREDIAESFLMYFGVTHRADRMETGIVEQIRVSMPNRLDYFEKLGITPLTWTDITQSMTVDSN